MHDGPGNDTPVRRKILVVDDEPINIQVMHRTFSQDHQVFMATSGEQAIVTAMRQQPDIILLDVSMPGLDGFETCERLKAELSTRDIPVIFVTAHNDPVRETRGLEVGAVDFISKPINPPLVRARVANHIALKVQWDRLRQMVFVDSETGCYNRRYFDSRLSVEWARARRAQTPMSLLLIELPAGEASPQHLLRLKLLASCVQAQLKRPGDLMGRWDDQRLACILPGADTAGVIHIAECIRTAALAGLGHIQMGLATWQLKGEHTIDDLVALALAQLPPPGNRRDQRLALRGTGVGMTTAPPANALESGDVLRQLQALEGATLGLWDWRDPTSHELWWSHHFYRLLGYEPDELAADLVSLDHLVHPSYQAVLFAALERAWQQKEAMDIQIQLRTKAQGYRWFRCQSRVLTDGHGRVQHVAGTLEDIHERKLAQKAAAEAHEQLQAIFTLSDDGFVAFGADGKINFCSPAFYTLTGVDYGTLDGSDELAMLQALHERVELKEMPVSLDAMLTTTAHARQTAAEFANRAVIATRHSPARMLELRLQRGQGRVTQMLHVRDVTQEIEVERMKSDFLSIAAHELRTPMTSIYGFVSLVLNQSFPPEKQRNLLERVCRQCQSMIEIINELLDLARIEAKGASEFEFTDVDLCVLANEVIRDFKLPDGREPPEVEWPEEPMLVRVDLQKTRQAVLNVLSNAYKYSPQGGPVHIDFKRMADHDHDHDYLSVCVRDHGIGMTAEQLQHFGERFYRADRSGPIPGTGLGVSIVREIVEHMGGIMKVDSAHGEGTQVTLLLRASAMPA